MGGRRARGNEGEVERQRERERRRRSKTDRQKSVRQTENNRRIDRKFLKDLESIPHS